MLGELERPVFTACFSILILVCGRVVLSSSSGNSSSSSNSGLTSFLFLFLDGPASDGAGEDVGAGGSSSLLGLLISLIRFSGAPGAVPEEPFAMLKVLLASREVAEAEVGEVRLDLRIFKEAEVVDDGREDDEAEEIVAEVETDAKSEVGVDFSPESEAGVEAVVVLGEDGDGSGSFLAVVVVVGLEERPIDGHRSGRFSSWISFARFSSSIVAA